MDAMTYAAEALRGTKCCEVDSAQIHGTCYKFLHRLYVSYGVFTDGPWQIQRVDLRACFDKRLEKLIALDTECSNIYEDKKSIENVAKDCVAEAAKGGDPSFYEVPASARDDPEQMKFGIPCATRITIDLDRKYSKCKLKQLFMFCATQRFLTQSLVFILVSYGQK
jgi:hypothetical protein